MPRSSGEHCGRCLRRHPVRRARTPVDLPVARRRRHRRRRLHRPVDRPLPAAGAARRSTSSSSRPSTSASGPAAATAAGSRRCGRSGPESLARTVEPGSGPGDAGRAAAHGRRGRPGRIRGGIDCGLPQGRHRRPRPLRPRRPPAPGPRSQHGEQWGIGTRWLDADEATARLAADRGRGRDLQPELRPGPPAPARRRTRRARSARRGHRSTRACGSRRSSPGRVRLDAGRHRRGRRTSSAPPRPGRPAAGAPPHGRARSTRSWSRPSPSPARLWARIGLGERETFSDHRHVIIYGQRTADDRLAFGGRGAPYHFGSRITPEFDHDATGFRRPARDPADLLPQLGGVEFTHAWGGPLGIARDWHPSRRPRPGDRARLGRRLRR